jgi:predicted component of type VI protein secretion system
MKKEQKNQLEQRLRELAKLLGVREFLDALPGHLLPDSASQERITTVMARLREIGQLQ